MGVMNLMILFGSYYLVPGHDIRLLLAAVLLHHSGVHDRSEAEHSRRRGTAVAGRTLEMRKINEGSSLAMLCALTHLEEPPSEGAGGAGRLLVVLVGVEQVRDRNCQLIKGLLPFVLYQYLQSCHLTFEIKIVSKRDGSEMHMPDPGWCTRASWWPCNRMTWPSTWRSWPR